MRRNRLVSSTLIFMTLFSQSVCGNASDSSSDSEIAALYGLSADLAPGQNFDLLGWKLNTALDDDFDGDSDDVSETDLDAGYTHETYFYTGSDGGLVMYVTIAGETTSSGVTKTRTELREMLRRGDTDILTKDPDGYPNKNNWVFSSAPDTAQTLAGAVDGKLRATLSMNAVTTTGEKNVGKVVIGQIHAKGDEPVRLYYRKLVGHVNATLYAAHEVSGGGNVYYDLLGSRSDDETDPADGIPLDEIFTYEIIAQGDYITVDIYRDGVLSAEQIISISDSGYDVEDDYMFFKAGIYNQNDSGDDTDFVQATFYEIKATH